MEYIAGYTIINGGYVGIKKINYLIDDSIEWDLISDDRIIESGESTVEYDEDSNNFFKVGELEIPLNECMTTY